MKTSEMPYLTLRSSSRLSTCACTDTSRADTGSSQMITFGSSTRARAIEMRWAWPPENSCGPAVHRGVGVDADVVEHLAHLARRVWPSNADFARRIRIAPGDRRRSACRTVSTSQIAAVMAGTR